MRNKTSTLTAALIAQMQGGARRAIAGSVVLIALLMPVAAHAQQQADATEPCGCSGLTETQATPVGTLLVNCTRISSAFGPRRNPIFGTPEIHTGIDIAAPLGAPIYAAADGIVTIAWLCGGYGNYVLIRHANDTATGYAHASRFARGIYSGARVKAGQIIAYVGSTGLSTGPHLHFEIFVKGQPVRPACGFARSR